MPNPSQSLKWITDILNNLNIPYQIAGGLAARVYGSTRELDDIDIDIPEDQFEILKSTVKDFIIFGPERFHDEHWDVLLMTLDHHEQKIDIAGAHQTKIFNHVTKTWHLLHTDFSQTNLKEIFGIKVPVISKENLIAYKKMLGRDVDVADINELL